MQEGLASVDLRGCRGGMVGVVMLASERSEQWEEMM